jgi:hypothetical protein
VPRYEVLVGTAGTELECFFMVWSTHFAGKSKRTAADGIKYFALQHSDHRDEDYQTCYAVFGIEVIVSDLSGDRKWESCIFNEDDPAQPRKDEGESLSDMAQACSAGCEKEFIEGCTMHWTGVKSCIFTIGNGYGALDSSAQVHVGEAATREQCLNMVMDQQPNANGVTYSRNEGTECYAEFNMTKIDATLQADWQSCLIRLGGPIDAYDYCRHEINQGTNQYLVGAGCEIDCVSTEAMNLVQNRAEPSHAIAIQVKFTNKSYSKQQLIDIPPQVWNSAPGDMQASTQTLNVFDEGNVIGMHYIGCFIDRMGGQHDLEGKAGIRMGAHSSRDTCAKICAGFRYMGMQGTGAPNAEQTEFKKLRRALLLENPISDDTISLLHHDELTRVTHTSDECYCDNEYGSQGTLVANDDACGQNGRNCGMGTIQPPPLRPLFSASLDAAAAALAGVNGAPVPDVKTASSGYFGAGYVSYTGPADQLITFTVAVPLPGTYMIAVGYALDSDDRPLELSANGLVLSARAQPGFTDDGLVHFTRTDSWSHWKTTANFPVVLNEGANQITLRTTGASGGYIDGIHIEHVAEEPNARACTFVDPNMEVTVTGAGSCVVNGNCFRSHAGAGSSKYPPHTQCTFTASAAGVLRVQSFDVEADGDTCESNWDHLTVKGVRYCGGESSTSISTSTCAEATVTVNVQTTYHGSEVRWQIDDGEVFGPYNDWNMYTETICLEAGVHSLNYMDTYDDGWHGGTIEVAGYVGAVLVEGSGGVHAFTVLQSTATNTYTGPLDGVMVVAGDVFDWRADSGSAGTGFMICLEPVYETGLCGPGYSAVRLTVTRNNGAPAVCYGELELYGPDGTAVDFSSVGVTITDTGSRGPELDSADGYSGNNVISTDGYCSETGSFDGELPTGDPETIVLTFDTPVKFVAFQLGQWSWTYNPKDFTLEGQIAGTDPAGAGGSGDGVWRELASGHNFMFNSDGHKQTFSTVDLDSGSGAENGEIAQMIESKLFRANNTCVSRRLSAHYLRLPRAALRCERTMHRDKAYVRRQRRVPRSSLLR